VLDAIFHFFHALFDPNGLRELIRSGGAPLICTIVFIETGFFVGFFLPGDSLLVTAGILSAGGVIPLKWLLIPVMLCAIVGDQIGYWIGRSAGAALYRREDSLFFRKSHLQRAHDFYEKYGGRAVILARFVPIIRTFCPPVAGAARMPYTRYPRFRYLRGHFLGGRHDPGQLFSRAFNPQHCPAHPLRDCSGDSALHSSSDSQSVAR